VVLLEKHLLGEAGEHLGLVLAGEGRHFLGRGEVQDEVVDEVEHNEDKKSQPHEKGPNDHHLHKQRVSHATILQQE